MGNHETLARRYHKEGNNCSVSLHRAFEKDTNISKNVPLPRSEEGKCGAVIVTEKILREKKNEDKIMEYEKQFVSKFGSIKCIDLMKKDRKCNDYVGESASILDKLINNI